MSRTLAIGCAVVCAGVLAGCGGSHRLGVTWPRGYLYPYGNGVAFVQLQRHGDRLHGTLSGVGFDATPYGPLAPERYRRATVADYLAVAARKTAEAIRMQKKSGTG
jgi:hypothetical protein